MNSRFIICLFSLIYAVYGGILYPKPSVRREVKTLDGLWSFSILNNETEYENGLSGNNDKDISVMPVPSSYNDILTSVEGRDHVGCVKYEKIIEIPYRWTGNRIWLRFGSVCYAAEVYINDTLILSHEVGHLPFETEVTSFFADGETTYKLAVIVNNTLTNTTIPQGTVQTIPGGRKTQTLGFDFANYAGIDRPVVLYTIYHKTRIEDITIITNIEESSGIVNYEVEINGNDNVTYDITILDKDETVVGSSNSNNSSIIIPNATFWWPYLMNDNPGYLYTFKVDILVSDFLVDTYQLPFGIRELAWDNNSFTINGKPLYLRGFGRHEDSDIRGKGFDLPLIIRDHNLMRWIGANSYRTSHYPYAEEIMDLADRLGIMIIDEVPAVDTINYSQMLLDTHKKALEELYQRDKNRPSVILWSLANEPYTNFTESESYYEEIVAHMKSFDQTRPVTVVNQIDPDKDHSGQFLDIICFNRYDAWYGSPGEVSSIIPNTLNKTNYWRQLHNKPVIMTEYGADSYTGLHSVPSYIWSEEYQLDVMSEHFEVFDQLRETGWFIGEFIWNFADFQTAQSTRRVGGNRKGVFTRDRQPKASAYLLRQRYWYLAQKIDNATTVPDDLERYVISPE